jgi:hypothetical protein
LADQTIRDPTGFEAILTEQCWVEHVTRNHPEMAAFRQWVGETVEAPDGIYFGRRDPSRRVYARRFAHVPGVGNELTLLVFADNEDRHVATAYFTAHRLGPIGRAIWPSK